MPTSPLAPRLLGLCLAPAVLLLPAAPAPAADDIRVAVVAILASGDCAKVDADVEPVAREVRKKYPALTGFRMARMTCQPVPAGKEATFKLVDDEAATVAVDHAAEKEDRVRVRVKPPQLMEITYTTCCGKYFPIVTPYQTRDRQEQLIIAIMVCPCKDR
jgi:hypothetical protein